MSALKFKRRAIGEIEPQEDLIEAGDVVETAAIIGRDNKKIRGTVVTVGRGGDAFRIKWLEGRRPVISQWMPRGAIKLIDKQD